jgi:hypothetical protein
LAEIGTAAPAIELHKNQMGAEVALREMGSLTLVEAPGDRLDNAARRPSL